MKKCLKWLSFWMLASLIATTSAVSAQSDAGLALTALEEKVQRLSGQIEDMQVRHQQLQKDIEKLQQEVQEIRRATGSLSTTDLKALEERIAAVDAARQKDRQAIIDQLAKELAGLGSGKPPVKTGDGKEHTVVKGDTLSSIAKHYGVTLAELRKANSMSGDDIKPGQKLVIPR